MKGLLIIFLLTGLLANGQREMFHALNQSAAAASPCTGVSDADACNFITAIQLTDATQKTALDNLVQGLKTDGLWTKIFAAYPLASDGVALTREQQHSYNLKDATAYQATLTGIASNAAGFKTNGAGGNRFNTNVDLSHLGINANNYSIGVYSGENVASDRDLMGVSNVDESIYPKFNGDGRAYAVDVGSNNVRVSAAMTNAAGFTSYSSTASGLTLYKNGAPIATNSTVAANPITSGTMKGGEQNTQNISFMIITTGLTDTEMANLAARINTYQTALGRNVY